ncbi:TolC family protein [Hydrogenimonas urashimensis]|uniref:TolC family protein n=1 Tax=Hydrogenimonas urashimensis TaxID=2740515 RepID=UPI0019153896|nr:TolC family protein [Hydrogenimonas urashimensis]
MKRRFAISVAVAVGFATQSQAATMTELFDALKKNPVTQMDVKSSEYAELSAQKVKDAFYPRASLFATYEHYNSPTNLRPMSPAESIKVSGHGEPLPFATTIERLGGRLSMPIFVKELFALADQARSMAQSAKAKERLNLLEHEALLLGSDASWRYLVSLKKALAARKRSIEKMLEDTRIKVTSGRAPGVTLDKMEESINRLDIAVNDIDIKQASLRSRIASLTGLELDEPAPISQKRGVQEGEIFALKPLEYGVEAKAKGIDASYGRLYPRISLSAVWSENYGQNAVNTVPPSVSTHVSDDVHRSYGNYMVGVTMPLFEKGTYTDIERARVALEKEKLHLAKMRQELLAKTKALKTSLKLYTRSIELAKKSVQKRESLLEYAKVALQAGRLTEEEYLRYEEGLLDAQSKVFEAQMKRWQTMAQLAVIYGNDLKTIVE